MDLALLSGVVSQIAIALEYARLLARVAAYELEVNSERQRADFGLLD
jgi:hypothetical protein